MSIVQEPALQLHVIEEVEVVVAGGGPGGVAAATTAAREGADVLLVERYGYPGGGFLDRVVVAHDRTLDGMLNRVCCERSRRTRS